MNAQLLSIIFTIHILLYVIFHILQIFHIQPNKIQTARWKQRTEKNIGCTGFQTLDNSQHGRWSLQTGNKCGKHPPSCRRVLTARPQKVNSCWMTLSSGSWSGWHSPLPHKHTAGFTEHNEHGFLMTVAPCYITLRCCGTNTRRHNQACSYYEVMSPHFPRLWAPWVLQYYPHSESSWPGLSPDSQVQHHCVWTGPGEQQGWRDICISSLAFLTLWPGPGGASQISDHEWGNCWINTHGLQITRI